MPNYQNLLQIQIGSNTGQEYLWAAVIFITAVVVLKLFQVIILRALKKAALKTKTDLDDVLISIVSNIKPPFYFLASVYLGLKVLTLPGIAVSVIDGLFIVVVAYEIIKALQDFIDYTAKKLISRTEDEDDAQDESAIGNITTILKILLWILAILAVLSNWGINITSLVAGLGIGGLAIALAAQSILQDVFSSFSIFIDKPFKVGDFIKAGSDSGTIEKIGIKTTRIRATTGEELVISNQELTSTRIRNFKRMERRRAIFTLGVAYETPLEKLKKIPGIIEEIVEIEELAEFDRVHFKEYGDFSLNFEVSYYIATSDYKKYMDILQLVNFAIKEAFEKEEIEFAYPTQTLFIKKI